ncbi:cupredoxin domain-containing protein [Lapidilactobacillus mulanensis]|uniref:Cupredoxin domain-containing protein n=1 Tax=Lapidilactobacillus mulanensis TaxID=2485999 RepID=A0ABW4DQR5_9LACO
MLSGGIIMTTQSQNIEVIVDGGYQPSTVTLKQGQPAQLTFKRLSDKGCLDTIVLPEFGIKKFLPLNEAQTFNIDTAKAGEYQFSCGMDMAHGKVVIQ